MSEVGFSKKLTLRWRLAYRMFINGTPYSSIPVEERKRKWKWTEGVSSYKTGLVIISTVTP